MSRVVGIYLVSMHGVLHTPYVQSTEYVSRTTHLLPVSLRNPRFLATICILQCGYGSTFSQPSDARGLVGVACSVSPRAKVITRARGRREPDLPACV